LPYRAAVRPDHSRSRYRVDRLVDAGGALAIVQPMLAAASPSLWTQLAAAIPLALLATLSPTSVAVIIWYLGLESPRRLVTSYLGGALLITALVALAALLLLQGTQTVPHSHPTPSATVDIVLGLVLLGTAVVVARHQPKAKDAPKERRHDPRGAFALGVVMWTPSVAYLAALKLISDANAPAVSTVLASLVVIFCVLLVLEIPIGFYFFYPDRTELKLKAFHEWLHRHGRTLLAWGLAVGGVYMVVHGIVIATSG
jgi:Sap, sulfolipid-1-addressing protein